MRFLLHCVGCCVIATATSADADPSSPASPATDETRSLVSPATDTRISRRRRGTSSSAEWRPSLFAISEDNNGPVRPDKAVENPNRSRRAKVAVVKSTAGSRNANRCAPSSNARSHDFGHNPIPMMVPAFSAAPFMF